MEMSVFLCPKTGKEVLVFLRKTGENLNIIT